MTEETPVAEAHARRTRYEILAAFLAGAAALFSNIGGLALIPQIIVSTVFGVIAIYAAISVFRTRAAKKKGL